MTDKDDDTLASDLERLRAEYADDPVAIKLEADRIVIALLEEHMPHTASVFQRISASVGYVDPE